MIFYGTIRIPRISGNFGACADSVYQALLSPHEREPGYEATSEDSLEENKRKAKERLMAKLSAPEKTKSGQV